MGFLATNIVKRAPGEYEVLMAGEMSKNNDPENFPTPEDAKALADARMKEFAIALLRGD